MDINLSVYSDDEVIRLLTRVNRKLDQLLQVTNQSVTNQGVIMADLTALQTAVEEDAEVNSSAITLIEGLAQQIEDLADDPEALAALAGQLRTQSAALAAAVEANTVPVEPEV